MNIKFYRDGKQIYWSDDEDNPSGITFDEIRPVDTSELSAYLENHSLEFERLSTLRNSNDEDIANNARKAINKLNTERQFKLLYAAILETKVAWSRMLGTGGGDGCNLSRLDFLHNSGIGHP